MTWVWKNSASTGPWASRVRSAARAGPARLEGPGGKQRQPPRQARRALLDTDDARGDAGRLGDDVLDVPTVGHMAESLLQHEDHPLFVCLRCSSMVVGGHRNVPSKAGSAVLVFGHHDQTPRQYDRRQRRAMSLARSTTSRATKAGCRLARVGPMARSRCTGAHCRSRGASGSTLAAKSASSRTRGGSGCDQLMERIATVSASMASARWAASISVWLGASGASCSNVRRLCCRSTSAPRARAPSKLVRCMLSVWTR